MHKPFLDNIVIKSKNKVSNHIVEFQNKAQIFYLYNFVEKAIYNKEYQHNSYNPYNSIYHIFIYWSIINRVKTKMNSKIIIIDSIIRYFTSLVILKTTIKSYQEIPSNFFFYKYNRFYTFNNKIEFKSNISTQDLLFYIQKTNDFLKNEFITSTYDVKLLRFNSTYSNITSKPFRKYNKKKLVSKQFFSIIQESEDYICSPFKNKIKFKHLFKYAKKIKYSFFTKSVKIPFKFIYAKKTSKISNKKNKFTMILKNKRLTTDSYSFRYKLAPTQFNEAYINTDSTSQVKNIISILTQSNFSFYKLNALSITRFQFEIARNERNQKKGKLKKTKKSALFLNELERKMSIRYRYVAIYIKDLVRITFFCMYLKNVNFMVKFYCFLLSKLPRNRKETKLIKFFITILKIFSSQRSERIAIRLRFQGRVNRWRRTKNITGQKGYLEYYSYKSRIEFGIGQAITRKGTQGIRIWLCYNSYFKKSLKQSIFDYMNINYIK